ncbi:MAG TPA: HAD family phosphatase, partial [Fusobacteriaceae bacterium]|nr:HAD family phosphatase [Fusobacteriaceae bacterium]
MIKNVIFDLGRVLINFDPETYLKELGLNSDDRKIYLNDIFKGSEWLDLDRGVIDEEQAIETIVAKGRIKEKEVRKVLDERIHFFTELSLNSPLVKKIKDKGYKLYILSNFPKIPFEILFKKYEFFRNFDGGVISYEEGVNVIKPDSRIYDILLSRYNLLPEETVFIDDTLVNIEKAEEYG